MKKATSVSLRKNAALIVCILCVIATAPSCKKDASPASSSTTTATVSEADAAEVVTDAVTPQSSGMVTQASQASVMAASTFYACGTSFDSSIAGASAAGASVSWAYSLAWGWKLSCESPANFTASFKGNSSYAAPRMQSLDSSSGSFVITGIQPLASAYLFNSTYTRSGSQQSKVGNKNKFTSTLTITSSNIQVSKTTLQIVSGSAAAAISGTSSSGKSFSFSGTITFNGSKTATLVISGGGTYQIAW